MPRIESWDTVPNAGTTGPVSIPDAQIATSMRAAQEAMSRMVLSSNPVFPPMTNAWVDELNTMWGDNITLNYTHIETLRIETVDDLIRYCQSKQGHHWATHPQWVNDDSSFRTFLRIRTDCAFADVALATLGITIEPATAQYEGPSMRGYPDAFRSERERVEIHAQRVAPLQAHEFFMDQLHKKLRAGRWKSCCRVARKMQHSISCFNLPRPLRKAQHRVSFTPYFFRMPTAARVMGFSRYDRQERPLPQAIRPPNETPRSDRAPSRPIREEFAGRQDQYQRNAERVRQVMSSSSSYSETIRRLAESW